MTTKFFDSIIMLRFVKKKMTKEEFYDKKKIIKIIKIIKMLMFII